MRKEDKGAIIAQLGEMLNEYPHFYLVDVEGMDASSTTALRRQCFEKELKMVVVKNTLFEKALESKGEEFSALKAVLKGTTAIMFTQVANAPAKLIKEYQARKAEKPALKAAYAEEGIYVGADQLDVLCSIKSKNEVIAEIVSLLQSPAKNVLSALQSGQNTIHGVLKTLGEKGE
ncbi:MAG: 50S ribosomal protein L10 [Bacteroidaceae bacterium]